jgi:hypothetical protein
MINRVEFSVIFLFHGDVSVSDFFKYIFYQIIILTKKKAKTLDFWEKKNPKKYSFQFSIFSVDPNPSTGGKK